MSKTRGKVSRKVSVQKYKTTSSQVVLHVKLEGQLVGEVLINSNITLRYNNQTIFEKTLSDLGFYTNFNQESNTGSINENTGSIGFPIGGNTNDFESLRNFCLVKYAEFLAKSKDFGKILADCKPV